MRHFLWLPLFLCLLIPIAVQAQTFVIGDSTATVTNPAGLSAGNSISFQGNINVAAANAVELTDVPGGVSITFEQGSTTNSGAAGNDGVSIFGPFSGSFTNHGLITSSSDDGIDFQDLFTGTFLNTGIIRGDDKGLDFSDDAGGTIINEGTISGGFAGVEFDEDLDGTFINRGTITGGFGGVGVLNDLDGSFVNYGTISADLGVFIGDDLEGSFMNMGSISGVDAPGVVIDDFLIGSFANQGTITSANTEGIYIFRQVDTGTFTNSGTINGGLDGVYIDLDMNGTFTNAGTITGRSVDGVYIGRNMNGDFSNTGTIRGGGFHGVHVDRNLTGRLDNFGSITAPEIGVLVSRDFTGTLFNCGIIEGTDLAGVRFGRQGTGTVINDGGRIQGGNFSVRLGGGDGTLVLSGPSHLVGTIGGGGGSDTIRFENMRGISAAKRAELASLAASDPTTGSITLFGETIDWRRVEDIQADLSTLQSYESLITGAGLQQYAAALDNILGLDDPFREFLKELNKADAALLNELASNSSGQTMINGFNDFVRNQDSRIYSLLMSEFSTLRGDVSGAGQQTAGTSSGLFAREVPVGATVTPTDDLTTTFVTGYFGSGTQSRSLVRQDSSYDNTTILFGASQNFSEEWRFGVFGGYTDDESAVDQFGSLLKNEVAYIGVNANFSNDFLFANLIATLGFHDQTSVRRDFLGNRMDGDTTGQQGMFYTQVGRDLYFGETGQTKVSPYTGFAVSAAAMGDYTENGNTATALRFADETTTSVQTVLGVNASCYKDTSYGWIKPRVDAAWWHEYTESDRYGVSLAAPGLLNGFDIFSPGTNRNRGVFQIGTSIGFDCWENAIFDLSYFGTTGDDGLSAHGGAFSATFEF